MFDLDGYYSILYSFVQYDRKVGNFWAGGRRKSLKVVGSISSWTRGASSGSESNGGVLED